jgi:hypothetical protein
MSKAAAAQSETRRLFGYVRRAITEVSLQRRIATARSRVARHKEIQQPDR